MQIDAMKIIGIVGTVLVLGLLLKDADKFNTLAGSVSGTIKQLEAAG